MEIYPIKRKLIALVQDGVSGKMCLPEFQRDFVWKRDEVADLIRSVLRNYYVGSLLTLDCDPQRPPFAPTFLRGAQPESASPQPDKLLLDGQQRISSLIYALTAPNLNLKDTTQRRYYFVDLEKLIKDTSDDEIVFDLAARETDELQDPVVQYARRILPCTCLISDRAFLAWRDGFDDWLRETDRDAHELFRNWWRDQWTRAVGQFLEFDIPIVALPRIDESDRESIGRVCAIFEKLNSTGVELSVYDLLTAKLYKHGIRLHDLWGETCKKHEIIQKWSGGKADTDKFGVLILRTLALLRGEDPKPGILINLDPTGFVNDWHRAASAFERALHLLTHVGVDGCGVFSRKYLTGFGLIPVFAALRAVIEDRGLGEKERADLRRWYWCSVFLERYSSAVESKSIKDFKEMVGFWLNDGPEPALFGEARARIGATGYTVRESASYASSIYSGIFCLLALGGARDWRLGESIQLQNLNDHHIFPKNYLRNHGFPARSSKVNSIVNRTLISDETNRLISDSAPAGYLSDERIFGDAADAGRRLTAHFIDSDTLTYMSWATDSATDSDVVAAYDSFLESRERLIVSEIRNACGISPEQ